MKITSVDFIVGAVKPEQFPVGKMPEVAFAGKSNVGKSSLLNTLLNRKRAAKTSKTPGKTREVNFFEINNKFRMVDLPGYGYAKVPDSEKIKWQKVIETYLENRAVLKCLVWLLDIRHDPTKLDMQFAEYLIYHGYPVILALTKADKLSKNKQMQQKSKILKSLPFKQDTPVVLFSSLSKQGRLELLNLLLKYI